MTHSTTTWRTGPPAPFRRSRTTSLGPSFAVYPSSSFGIGPRAPSSSPSSVLGSRSSTCQFSGRSSSCTGSCSSFLPVCLPRFRHTRLADRIHWHGVVVRKQIQHMIKYRYVPFSFGKKNYTKNSSWSNSHLISITVVGARLVYRGH